jgi:hypothetical protein
MESVVRWNPSSGYAPESENPSLDTRLTPPENRGKPGKVPLLWAAPA